MSVPTARREGPKVQRDLGNDPRGGRGWKGCGIGDGRAVYEGGGRSGTGCSEQEDESGRAGHCGHDDLHAWRPRRVTDDPLWVDLSQGVTSITTVHISW